MSSAGDPAAILEKNLDDSLAASAEAVEVVFVDGRYSHLEYLTVQPEEKPAVPAVQQDLRIDRPQMKSFGSCRTLRNGTVVRGKSPGGFVVQLGTAEKPADLLRLPTLTITGRVEGRWKVAFADEHLYKLEENVEIGEIGGSSTLSLHAVSRQADLRQGRLLVLILDSPKGRLEVENIRFSPAAQKTVRQPDRGIWMWDQRPAVQNPRRVADDLQKRAMGRLYLQVGDDVESLAPFLREARRRGIAVWALDGSPAYALDAEPLFARLGRVRDFNRKFPEAAFAGFQVDIEPHLNPDFRVRLEDYGKALASVLSRLKREGDLPVSAVIPFWYDMLRIEDRSLAWHVLRVVDEGAIMSYRTSFAEIENISAEELAYGATMGIPVHLGLETSPIPDERHVVFRRCPAPPAAATTRENRWCRVREYTVPGGRVSFNGRPEELAGVLAGRPDRPAFGGWIVHSYESAPR